MDNTVKHKNNKGNGGVARAQSLSSEQRKEIAKKAAMARWSDNIPNASYDGELTFGDTKVKCAILDRDDKVMRVIVQREVVGLLTGSKKGNLDRYLNAKNIQPFIPPQFKERTLDQASIVVRINGMKAYCYEGESIVDLCKMYLDARKANNVLLPNQMRLADRAEIIVTALAKTGITGLIDEATGYQQVRAKDALQEYLSQVIRKELAAWVQRFPNDFFQEIYRLKKWPWTGSSRRPSVVGKYIADVVYSRLGPGVLDELERVNPKTEKGYRTNKHHQWLTEDVGHPMLAQHLYAITGLMRMSATWQEFKALLDRGYPKTNEFQLSLIN